MFFTCRCQQRYFHDTPWKDKIIPAENIIGALRGRKTNQEIDRIKSAINTTEEIYKKTINHAQHGMTELEISGYMHDLVREYGVEVAW